MAKSKLGEWFSFVLRPLVAPEKVAQSPEVKDAADSPDLPFPFGYKTSWIAIKTTHSAALVKALQLHNVERSSWKKGILGIYRDYREQATFVSPPVAGWTLVPGSHPSIEQSTFAPYVEALSRQFGEAFYFGTHRVVGYHAWAKARQGKLVRAFGYLGERGEFLLDVGERTADEIEMGIGIVDDDETPDEETVLDLASRWTLDPRTLESYPEALGPGWIGHR